MPHRLYLPHALPNERIILLLRRHWFVLFARVVLWGLVGLLPLALALLLPGDLDGMASSAAGYALLVVGLSSYYLFLWLFVLHAFVDYFLDVWIVTNERILNIEQQGLFSQVAAEQKLDRIQDVATEVHGPWATFLGYGEVHVQTAGEQARFVFEQIPNPAEVARKITSLCEARRQAGSMRDSDPTA